MNASRIAKVISIAQRMGMKLDDQRDYRSSGDGLHPHYNRVKDIQFFSHYCEPGYANPKSGTIALGNWNPIAFGQHDEAAEDLIVRLSQVLQKMGVELEWYDEWASCDDCHGIFRTQADSHFWRPSYHESTTGRRRVCNDCMKACGCTD